MIKLKKGHYLALYSFAGREKMVEIAETNQKAAERKALEYGETYSKSHENVSWTLVEVVLIPDCITVVE